MRYEDSDEWGRKIRIVMEWPGRGFEIVCSGQTTATVMLNCTSVAPLAEPVRSESTLLDISVTALPAALQEDLRDVEAIRSQETNLDGSIVEEALNIYVNHKKKRLKFDRFDERLSRKLASFDTNHDAFIEYSELEDAVDRVRFLRLVLLGMVLCSIILLGSIFGLVYVVVDLQKVCV